MHWETEQQLKPAPVRMDEGVDFSHSRRRIFYSFTIGLSRYGR
ncbi:hypothetical protein [Paenibacillus sp. 1A_MP2]